MGEEDKKQENGDKLDKLMSMQTEHIEKVGETFDKFTETLQGIQLSNASDFSEVKTKIGEVKEQAVAHRTETRKSLTAVHNRVNDIAEEGTETKTRLEEHMKDNGKHTPHSSSHLSIQDGGSAGIFNGMSPKKLGATIGGVLIGLCLAVWGFFQLMQAVHEYLQSLAQ